MDTFTAAKPPLTARFGTPLFIFGVLFVGLVAIMGILFYKAKTVEQETSTNAASKVITPATPPAAAKSEPAKPPPPLAPALAKNNAMAAAPASAMAPVPSASSSPVTTPSTVQIEFALVNHGLFPNLTQESSGALAVDTYSIAVVPNFKTKYSSVRGDPKFRSLAAENRSLTMNQPALVFRGGKEPNSDENIGFFVDVTPVKFNESGVDYKITIKRNLPSVSPTGEVKVISQNFDEAISIPHGSGVVYAGVLPREEIVAGEDALFKTPGNVLSALLDPGFQSRDDEFLIIIQPHFSEPTN